MWVLIGYGIIIVAVFGGFALSGGHLAAMFQPFEMVIIAGAAAGAFVVGNGIKVSKATASALPLLLKPSIYTKELHMEILGLLYDIQVKARREGLITLEKDADHPQDSVVFQRYPAVLANATIVEFLTDYLRLIVSGSMETMELEQLMDEEIDTHREAGEVPVNAISRMADSLPGFGIVAAVMGVVHTMESMGAPPEELGMLIARALVGTFLGILLAYGFVAPIGSLLEHRLNESTKLLMCIKVSLLTFLNGYPPAVAVEFGRKVLYSDERPSASELETHVKRK
ncbi:MAG TPA: flagellar motor stator protein MotA [Rhodothermales bacterium]|nr:flagellar motor stator protein MotA [Rhodothermales bacterium]